MRIYHGWMVVAASITAYMLVLGSTVSSFSLFVIPVSTELGLSRADMNTAYVMFNIGNAILAAGVGRTLNSCPARHVLAASATLLGLGFGVLSRSDSFWSSTFALAVLLPLGVNGSAIITLNVLVARWFIIHRTRAMALSTLGISLGAIVMPPATAALIASFGWRGALLFIAAVVAISLFTMALTIRERPGPEDIEPGQSEANQPRDRGASITNQSFVPSPTTTVQVLRSRPFWCISLSASLVLATSATLGASMAPIAIAKGLTTAQATSMITVSGATAAISTLLLASLAHRVDRRSLLAGLFLATAALNAALILSEDYGSLLGCAALLGIISGPSFPLFQAILVDQFGASSFGLVRGLTIPINAMAVAMAMRFAGEVFDRTGTYTPMLLAFVVIPIIAAAGLRAIRFAGARPDTDPVLATKQQ